MNTTYPEGHSSENIAPELGNLISPSGFKPTILKSKNKKVSLLTPASASHEEKAMPSEPEPVAKKARLDTEQTPSATQNLDKKNPSSHSVMDSESGNEGPSQSESETSVATSSTAASTSVTYVTTNKKLVDLITGSSTVKYVKIDSEADIESYLQKFIKNAGKNPVTTNSSSVPGTSTTSAPKAITAPQPAANGHATLIDPATAASLGSGSKGVKHIVVESDADIESYFQKFVANAPDKPVTLDSDSSSTPSVPSSSATSTTANSLLSTTNIVSNDSVAGSKVKSAVPSEGDKDLETLILDSLRKDPALFPDSTVKAVSVPVSYAGGQQLKAILISKKAVAPLENGAGGRLSPLTSAVSSNLTVKGDAKSLAESVLGGLANCRPSGQGNSIRMPVGSLQGKVLQCTSTTVSINSTTNTPKQQSTAPPKSVQASPNLLLALASQKQPTHPSIVRLAVKNGKLVPDTNAPSSSLLLSSKKVDAHVAFKKETPKQGQQYGTVSTSVPKMHLSTVPAIVPITEPKFRASKSLLHKNGNDSDQPSKKNVTDPPPRRIVDANQFFSSVGLSTKKESSLTAASSVSSQNSQETVTYSVSGPTSSVISAPADSTEMLGTLLPLTMLSSSTSTTSAILSAISSSAVPVLSIPNQVLPRVTVHKPIAPKPDQPSLPVSTRASFSTTPVFVTTTRPLSTSSGTVSTASGPSVTTSVSSTTPAPKTSSSVVTSVEAIPTSSTPTTASTAATERSSLPCFSDSNALHSPPASSSPAREFSLDNSDTASADSMYERTGFPSPPSPVIFDVKEECCMESKEESVVELKEETPMELDLEEALKQEVQEEPKEKPEGDSKEDPKEDLKEATSLLEVKEETSLLEEKEETEELKEATVEENPKAPSSQGIACMLPSDPKNLLNWTDIGIGPLEGSSIKFRKNEFGILEIDDNCDKTSNNIDPGDLADPASLKDAKVDDSSTNKENFQDFLLCKENVEESENSKENRNSNTAVKKNKRKDVRHEVRIDENDEFEKELTSRTEDKFEQMFNEKVESCKNEKFEADSKKGFIHKHKEEHRNDDKEEIFQCKSCNCYGLSNEFFNERSCSKECERTFKQKIVMAKKREYDLSDIKRKKKEKYYSLLKKEIQEQRVAAKEDIESKIEQIEKMDFDLDKVEFSKIEFDKVDFEKLDLKSLDDEPTSSCSSQILSQPKSPVAVDSNDDSNFDMASVCSNKSSSKSDFQVPPVTEAPYELFKSLETFKSDTLKSTTKIPNPFKVGMKLEGIDPEHQSYFCVMTVADVQGYRLRLHFDGYNECHDFWCNANSPDIFPVGWCESKKRELNPPLGYSKETFNWQSYLKQCRAKAAPTSLFRPAATKVSNQFKKGMKLEAVDRKNTVLTCVATVADTIDNRILIHFDSWGDVYDYWTDCTAPYIHPVGWCQEQDVELTPPTNHKSNKVFIWDEYMKETKSLPVPARAFKPRRNNFKVNMKLEAVDLRIPSLIRPATVIDIRGHQLKIAYDGFPDTHALWLDCDDLNIFPLGWCDRTRHHLEPLPCMDDVGDCGTHGCKGIGHVKGLKFVRHFSSQFCPYADHNLDLDVVYDQHIPDRLRAKPEAFEVDEPTSKPSVVRKELLDSLEATSSTVKSERSSSSPPESKYHVDSSNIHASSSRPHEAKKRGRKRKFLKEMESIGADSFDILRQEVIESVFRPGYLPGGADVQSWTKHADQLGISVIEADPRKWTHKQVTAFVTRIYNEPEKAQVFSEQEIDGEAFLMLTQKDLIDILGFKLGPAIKIFNAIVLFRQKIS